MMGFFCLVDEIARCSDDINWVEFFEPLQIVAVDAKYGTEQGQDADVPAEAGPEVIHTS